MNWLSFQRVAGVLMLASVLALVAAPSISWAQEGDAETPAAESAETTADDAAPEDEAPAEDLGVGYALDNAVLFIAAVLVFFMQAGFAMVECGFNSSKNAINILFKNSMDICIGVLLFFTIGFGIMYPFNYAKFTDQFADMTDEQIAEVKEANKYGAFGGIGLNDYKLDPGRTFSPETDWFFQAVFAATAATIVSGAVAGRMKVGAYLIYSAILTAFVYPVSGMWKWGGGWLDQMGFADFAGSAVVHGVGGFAGLAGALVLGPRIGRFVDGKSVPVPGHNITLAGLGVFILWFGWYGFNPGSQLAFQGTGDIDMTMHCAVTTTLAAGAGGLVATLLSWVMFGKPDLSMGLNGILGGLVGITACCDCMTDWQAMLVGGIAGVLVILGIMMLDKLKIDDPVGAWPVHGLCGMWGCLAIGVFGHGSLGVQAFSTAVICGWSFVTMFILFTILKAAGILRVTAEEEQAGLDISEHGMQAYGSH
ncbi:ammonium transporter [Aeoliella mucimassa]|uniref:Ammonium transporter n=1 Tax=Aeoliella mucimassa TaxID=2527972 RepID=A0A518ANX3_9BACT|nr:ammonium transporter [Aeoliella mucimassa]QDU56391.1 Ammonium transporter NrgA [Aeoliella mucimassa]